MSLPEFLRASLTTCWSRGATPGHPGAFPNVRIANEQNRSISLQYHRGRRDHRSVILREGFGFSRPLAKDPFSISSDFGLNTRGLLPSRIAFWIPQYDGAAYNRRYDNHRR